MTTNLLAHTPPQQSNALAEVASSRAAQEVQAAMVVAQRRPRDQNNALSKILESCKRKALAEKAVYAYPRGNQTVSGPSIRLAETFAQNWGNIDFGIVELETKTANGSGFGESTMMAYCWDLETNTRVTKIFTVKHKRDTKAGSVQLKDDRDIYENNANNGARRLRACILSVIPGDVIEAAVEQCQKTMAGGDGPIIDRARKMLEAFKEYGVSQTMIEKRLGHKMDAIIETELVRLREIFTSLRDGMGEREDFFDHEVALPKTIQNHAPKSKEEAQQATKEIRLKKAEEKPANPVEEALVSRFDLKDRGILVREMMAFAKENKLSINDYEKKAMTLFNQNQLQNLDAEQLKLIAQLIESEVTK